MITITVGGQQPFVLTGSSYLNEAKLDTPIINFFGPEILKILREVEGDVNSGKGVKLALWLAPSTSKPKTTVKYCEESERCYAHTGPDETVKISEELELTLTYNRPALAYANSRKKKH